jgi:hypothetical protein
VPCALIQETGDALSEVLDDAEQGVTRHGLAFQKLVLDVRIACLDETS